MQVKVVVTRMMINVVDIDNGDYDNPMVIMMKVLIALVMILMNHLNHCCEG